MSVKFKPTQIAMPLSANYGRWYAKMVPSATVTSHQLAEEVAHSSTVTQADMLAVFNELSVVLRKHLLNSDRVEIDGIGAFKVGLCTAAANTAADFGALSLPHVLARDACQ